MKEYYTKVSMDVAVVAKSPEEATEKLNQWLDGQQMIDKSWDEQGLTFGGTTSIWIVTESEEV